MRDDRLRSSKAQDVFDSWLQWVEVDKSPRTAHDYASLVKRYLKECKITDLNDVTPIIISEYINRPNKKMGKSMRNMLLVAIRQFHEYAFKLNHCTQDPACIVKVKNDNLTHKQKEGRKVEAFTDAEYHDLILYLDKEVLEIRSEKANIRNKYKSLLRCMNRLHNLNKTERWNRFFKAAVMLSYETGLRLSDVCQLEWDCWTQTELIVHTDKRDKRVAIPLWKEVREARNCIPNDSDTWCFPDERETIRDANRRSVFSKQFKNIIKRAGIDREGLSFHSLRHACLTKWKSGGMDLEHIQKLAGHSSSETTEGYIHS